MKKLLVFTFFFYLFSCNFYTISIAAIPTQIVYEIDLTNYKDDLFHVTVFTNGLSNENGIYNLPATVPGTYSNLNFGRFVRSFEAFNEENNPLEVEKLSTNQWRIKDANKLAKVVYDSEDTFDSDITEDKILPMGGTGINNDFIVLNTFGVLGFFEGLQTNPVKVKIDYQSD